MSTALVIDDCFMRHDTGPGHPERPARIAALLEHFDRVGLIRRCLRLEPEPAEEHWLLSNHSAGYLQRLRQACAAGARHIDCADSAICPATFDVARLAVGAVLKAVRAVQSGEVRNAFCAVRPPGHHAERAVSMGFCLFNNIAIAARFLLESGGAQRVAIVDWDVHHGNGTQHAFEDDPRVLFISLHGHPDTLYPGTGYAEERGRGAGEGTTINLPMMPGCGDAEYRRAFAETVVPAIDAYRPQFVLISAGFDAHRADPLADLHLESESFAWMTADMTRLAARHCDGRLMSVLEGGYDLPALAESAAIHVQGLLSA